MRTLLDVLHVLSAVLLVGPLMVTPFVGRRAIQRRNAEGVRMAANQTNLYGLGSLVTAGLGVLLTLAGDDDHKLTDPWIVISLTLYGVAVCLVFFYAVPALRRAARMIEEDTPARALPVTSGSAGEAPSRPAGEQLEAITGRVAMAAFLVLLVFTLITVLMTVFGD